MLKNPSGCKAEKVRLRFNETVLLWMTPGQKDHVWRLPRPCTTKAYPEPLLKGLVCGKPLISTDWKGARDTVEHGKNGFLIPAVDRRELRNCLLQCVDMPRSSLQAMGLASRRKAELEFNEDLVLQRYLDLIRKYTEEPLP